jgi:hypothetical protein
MLGGVRGAERRKRMRNWSDCGEGLNGKGGGWEDEGMGIGSMMAKISVRK